MKRIKITKEKLSTEQEFDLYTRTAVYEALDECAIYDNEQGTEDAAWDYVRYVRSEGLFLRLNNSNYQAFVLSIVSFLEHPSSDQELLVQAAKVLENKNIIHLSD